MRIVGFGTGSICEMFRNRIKDNDEIIAYLDNNPGLHGRKFHEKEIFEPQSIKVLDYDMILILSDCAVAMREQLIKLGVQEERIVHYLDYFKGEVRNLKNIKTDSNERNALIVTTPIGFHGGSIAAVNLAKALVMDGYKVWICADAINEAFKLEYEQDSICFIREDCRYPDFIDKALCMKFDLVIFNTYPMIRGAIAASKFKRVYLWLHESLSDYEYMDYWCASAKENLSNPNLNIWAVSRIAADNFKAQIGDRHIDIVPYALEDKHEPDRNKEHDALTFALIGTVNQNKQQLLFAESVMKINVQMREKCRFLIIGSRDKDEYYAEVKKIVDQCEEMALLPEMTSKELNCYYDNVIDIVVVPSLHETMSLAATEGMMHSKMIILTRNSGMAQYITHMQNGMLIDPRNGGELVSCMEFCINNRNKLQDMQKRARKTYEDNFSLEGLKAKVNKLTKRSETIANI